MRRLSLFILFVLVFSISFPYSYIIPNYTYTGTGTPIDKSIEMTENLLYYEPTTSTENTTHNVVLHFPENCNVSLTVQPYANNSFYLPCDISTGYSGYGVILEDTNGNYTLSTDVYNVFNWGLSNGTYDFSSYFQDYFTLNSTLNVGNYKCSADGKEFVSLPAFTNVFTARSFFDNTTDGQTELTVDYNISCYGDTYDFQNVSITYPSIVEANYTNLEVIDCNYTKHYEGTSANYYYSKKIIKNCFTRHGETIGSVKYGFFPDDYNVLIDTYSGIAFYSPYTSYTIIYNSTINKDTGIIFAKDSWIPSGSSISGVNNNYNYDEQITIGWFGYQMPYTIDYGTQIGMNGHYGLMPYNTTLYLNGDTEEYDFYYVVSGLSTAYSGYSITPLFKWTQPINETNITIAFIVRKNDSKRIEIYKTNGVLVDFWNNTIVSGSDIPRGITLTDWTLVSPSTVYLKTASYDNNGQNVLSGVDTINVSSGSGFTVSYHIDREYGDFYQNILNKTSQFKVKYYYPIDTEHFNPVFVEYGSSENVRMYSSYSQTILPNDWEWFKLYTAPAGYPSELILSTDNTNEDGLVYVPNSQLWYSGIYNGQYQSGIAYLDCSSTPCRLLLGATSPSGVSINLTYKSDYFEYNCSPSSNGAYTYTFCWINSTNPHNLSLYVKAPNGYIYTSNSTNGTYVSISYNSTVPYLIEGYYETSMLFHRGINVSNSSWADFGVIFLIIAMYVMGTIFSATSKGYLGYGIFNIVFGLVMSWLDYKYTLAFPFYVLIGFGIILTLFGIVIESSKKSRN